MKMLSSLFSFTQSNYFAAPAPLKEWHLSQYRGSQATRPLWHLPQNSPFIMAAMLMSLAPFFRMKMSSWHTLHLNLILWNQCGNTTGSTPAFCMLSDLLLRTMSPYSAWLGFAATSPTAIPIQARRRIKKPVLFITASLRNFPPRGIQNFWVTIVAL